MKAWRFMLVSSRRGQEAGAGARGGDAQRELEQGQRQLIEP